tara:strand:- start:104 stop:907 length:804 start_codon:yes stop_codon:yes gene_type:complete
MNVSARLKFSGYFILIAVFITYFCAMFLVPWCAGGYRWDSLQSVLREWQTFNSAMIALGASIIGLYAARRHAAKQEELANDQRHREFVAARAFLTESLSDLHFYNERLEVQYRLVYDALDEDDPLKRTTALSQFVLPQIPSSYKETFRACIRFAEPDFAEYLTEILNDFQIINSRARALCQDVLSAKPIVKQENIVAELCDIVHVQALCNRLYDFGRNKSASVNLSVITSVEEMTTVLSNWYFSKLGVDSAAMKLKGALVARITENN